jgi:hypothetical protein
MASGKVPKAAINPSCHSLRVSISGPTTKFDCLARRGEVSLKRRSMSLPAACRLTMTVRTGGPCCPGCPRTPSATPSPLPSSREHSSSPFPFFFRQNPPYLPIMLHVLLCMTQKLAQILLSRTARFLAYV